MWTVTEAKAMNHIQFLLEKAEFIMFFCQWKYDFVSIE